MSLLEQSLRTGLSELKKVCRRIYKFLQDKTVSLNWENPYFGRCLDLEKVLN